MIDRYTKIILTIIAVALSAIAIQGTVGTAQAQFGDGCGGYQNGCYVRSEAESGMRVYVTNQAPFIPEPSPCGSWNDPCYVTVR